MSKKKTKKKGFLGNFNLGGSDKRKKQLKGVRKSLGKMKRGMNNDWG